MADLDQSFSELEQAHENEYQHEDEDGDEHEHEHGPEVVHVDEDEEHDEHKTEAIEEMPENLEPDEKQDHPDVMVAGGAEKWPGWPGESVFRMLVPAQKVGSIIGRKGEYIKKTCEETKARIKILDGPPGTRERALDKLPNILVYTATASTTHVTVPYFIIWGSCTTAITAFIFLRI